MGKYAQIVDGEITGLKAGLKSIDDLWKYAQELEKESHQSEYLVGFGAGYTKGQMIREDLRFISDLSFKNKLEIVIKYLGKNDLFPKFSEFSKDINGYIENQNIWNNRIISNDVYATTIELLEKDLLQRALENIHKYYVNKKALKVVLEFEELKERLSGIRNKKKKNEIDLKGYLQEITRLKSDLLKWIKINKS